MTTKDIQDVILDKLLSNDAVSDLIMDTVIEVLEINDIDLDDNNYSTYYPTIGYNKLW